MLLTSEQLVHLEQSRVIERAESIFSRKNISKTNRLIIKEKKSSIQNL